MGERRAVIERSQGGLESRYHNHGPHVCGVQEHFAANVWPVSFGDGEGPRLPSSAIMRRLSYFGREIRRGHPRWSEIARRFQPFAKWYQVLERPRASPGRRAVSSRRAVSRASTRSDEASGVCPGGIARVESTNTRHDRIPAGHTHSNVAASLPPFTLIETIRVSNRGLPGG